MTDGIDFSFPIKNGGEDRLTPPIKNQGRGEGLHSESSFESALSNAVADKTKNANIRTDKKLRDTCVEMESIFIGKMLKEMRKNIHKSGWIDGGRAEEIFTDMLYDQYALNISRNSNMGLAKMIYEEMSRTLNPGGKSRKW
jgi:flagellar protein FlgJ